MIHELGPKLEGYQNFLYYDLSLYNKKTKCIKIKSKT